MPCSSIATFESTEWGISDITSILNEKIWGDTTMIFHGVTVGYRLETHLFM